MSKLTSIRVLLSRTLALYGKRVFVAFTAQKRAVVFKLAILVLLLTPVITTVYSITRAGTGANNTAYAVSPATLNFQARLLTSSGNIVPDGVYNVEFKVYNVDTGGSALWTETRLTTDPSSQQISVKNGYLSAYLGDKTALPTNIWNQQLWLTMNIGGTGGSPSWDGEMTPRIRLTSVPFAFRATVADSAETLSKNTGSFTGTVDFGTMTADRKFLFPDTSLATTASPGTICVYNGAASNCPASSGSAYYLQNDTVLQTQTNFHIQARDSTTNGTIGGVISGAANGQTVDLLQFRASDDTTVLAAVTAAGNLKVASSVDTYTAGTLSVGTTNASAITVGKSGMTTTVAGAVTVNEAATFNDNVTIAAQKTITLVGGTTAQRPASPTEGMFYFDSDTKQLLVYANGKWQADRSEAILVAASNSSQADKDAADYVADGDTGAANDGDQVQINAALTAGSGKKIVLLAGTYVADATILIPNNTMLAGVGQGTVIELADIDVTDNLIENSDTTTGTGVTIQDLKLDGRSDLNSAAAGQTGIYFSHMGGGSNQTARVGAKIVNVSVHRFVSNGMVLDTSNNNTITNSAFENNLQTSGIFLISSDNNTVTNNLFQGNNHGIRLNSSQNNTLTGNVVQVSTVGNNGITLTSANNNTITANTISGGVAHGIELDTSNQNVVSSNRIFNTGNTTNNNAIYLTAADSNTITDNTISDSSATTTNYAINIFNATSDSNYLSNNTLGNGSVNDASDATGGYTIYGGQLNSSGNFVIQPAGTIELVANTNITGNLTINGAGTFTSGTGVVLLQGNTDIANTVSLATKVGTTFTTAGTSNNAALNVASFYLLDTSGAAQIINGITAGRDGQRLTLTNVDTSLSVTLTNNSGAATGSKIITGTGSDMPLAVGASVELVYDSANTVWRVVGSAATSGGGANQQLSNLSGTIAINQSLTPGTDNTLDLGSTANSWQTLYADTSVLTPNVDVVTAGALGIGNSTATSVSICNSAACDAVTIGSNADADTITIGDTSDNVGINGTLTVTGNTSIATTAGNTLSLGNSTGVLTVTGNSSSTFVLNGVTVDATEFNRLDGKDAALVDTNDAVATAITGVGVLTAGTWNATAITDAYISDSISISSAGSVDWQALTGYPAACATGQAITQLGDTITCSGFMTGTAADYIQNQNIAQQATSNYWISGSGRADTSFLTPSLDVASAGTLAIGTTTANSISISKSGVTTTVNGALTVTQATTLNGTTALNDNVTVAAGKTIRFVGDTTANRPASPSEGTVYFDTDTKQLLIYANGKWQGDRSTATKIVAASNSSQAVKDAADYVASGTADQNTINAALTAAAGGKVYLAEGTYIVSASISIPNNTTLIGSGNSTLITLPASQNGSYNIITNTDTTSGTSISIRDLQIDGNRSNETSGTMYGIYLSSMGGGTGSSSRDGAKLSNITVRAMQGGDGIHLNASSNNMITTNTTAANDWSGVYIDNSSNNNTITGNISQGNTFAGFDIRNSSSNNTITGNTSEGNGVNFYVRASANNNTISGNTSQNAATGIYLFSASNNVVTGNNIQSSPNEGIHLESSSNFNTIASNNIDDSGSTTYNRGIYVSASDSNTISANNITDSAHTFNNAIDIVNNTSDNNYLSDNLLNGATINDSGTGTIYGGQATGSTFAIQPSSSFTLTGNATSTISTTAGNLTLQAGSGTVTLGSSTSLTATGALSITSGGSNTLSLDTGGAAALSIGTTNANALSISKTGVTTTVNGALTVAQVTRLNGNVGINIGAGTPSADLTFGESASRTINVQTRTTNAAGNDLTVAAGAAGSGASAFSGGVLTLQGGAAGGTGNANGGSVTIIGGAGVGTGTQGLVNLSTSAFTSAVEQSFAISTSVTAGNVDLYSTLPVKATAAALILTVPDPAQNVIGRLLYISARSGSADFTMRLNNTRTPIDIAMKANSTATLIWNGTDWTAAGASSSTDLQSAYNNTLTSAGGAEIVLNASGGAADGFTIRNNGTTPISGGILEVQSSIGTNLFSVNNYGTELAANGGAETSATFSTNWTSIGSAGAPTRTTTSGQYITGQAGVAFTTTAAANDGVRNNLSGNPVVSTTYQVSFAAKLASGTFTTLQVAYTRDGGTNFQTCTSYSTQTITTSEWTKITCTITTDGTSPINPDLVIRQTDATARTIYLDNLSFIRNDSTTQPSNVQIGGGTNGGPITLFTLDRSTAPPVAAGNDTYLGSMYYDTTTGRIQCYESDGWGACGSAPDNIITLTPEYTGAVLNGSGVGTLTADFCANGAGLSVNTSVLCATSGEARNFYKWTTPQATDQTYSIYVTYKLPATFKQFTDSNTIKLTALTTDTTKASAALQVYRKAVGSSTLYACGASATTINNSNNAWQQTNFAGDETTCNGNGAFVGGDYIIFKIDVIAKGSASIYVENLDFTFTNK